MSINKNKELFKKHRWEISEMIYKTLERAPIKPFLPTLEEQQQYEKEVEAFVASEKPKILKKLVEMGFEIKE